MRYIHAFALVLLSCSMLSACRTPGTGSSDKKDGAGGDSLARALSFYSQGLIDESEERYDAAFSNYMEAVRLDPDAVDLHFRVAMSLLQRKQATEAQQIMEKLVARNPKSDKAQLGLALIYRATEQPEKAMKVYERVVAFMPSASPAYLEMAGLHMRAGDADEAFKVLDQALGKVDEKSDILKASSELVIRAAAARSGEPADTNRLAKLIGQVSDYLKNNPGDQTLLYNLGDLYIINQQIDKAVECFEKIERLQPDDPRIKQKLALSFIALGDKDKAIENLEELARKNPTNARLFYYLGELYEQVEDKSKAILNYRLATKAAPDEPATYLKLAMLQMEDDPEESIKVLKEGAEKLPKDPRLLEMIAYVYMSKEDYEPALQYFASARSLQEKTKTPPMTPRFDLNLAVTTHMAGKGDEAARLIEYGMTNDPAFLNGFMRMVMDEKDEENLQRTIDLLDKLVTKFPSDPQIHLYIGLFQSYAKDYPAAVAAFEKTRELAATAENKDDILTSLFYFWLGAAYERQGMFEKADEHFRTCILLDPEHAEAYNYLAYMWAEKGLKLDEALNLSRKSLELDNDNAAFIDTLGWIYFMKGDYENALKEISRAANLLPDDPTIVEHMGDVSDKLGKRDKAIMYWKRAFVFDPSNEKLAAKLTEAGVDLAPLREEAAAKAQTEEPAPAEEQP